jgi:AAA domain
MPAEIARLAEEEIEAEMHGFIRPLRGKRNEQPASIVPFVQRADELLLKEFEPIRWAIQDMIPEGVSLLVGPPKVGKSWLTLQFAIAITSGSQVWNGRSRESAGDVLMLGLEDNDRRLQSRIKKLRAAEARIEVTKYEVKSVHVPDVSRLHFATEWPRMDKGGLDHLDDWLGKHPQARMVIIDTLGRFRPPENGRGSAYQSDYAIGAALKPLADRHRVALVLVHHTRKMSATDVLDTVSGTQGLTGSVDALLLLRRERGQMDAALYVTGRDIEHEEDYALQFHPQSCTWSALGRVHEVAITRERQEILDFIGKNGPSKPKDIAEGIGKKGAAIRRLLQKLFADNAVKVEDGKYSLIHSSGNSGNNGKRGHSGDSGDTDVTPVTVVTAVTAVTGGAP